MVFRSLTFLFLFFSITFLLYALVRSHWARNLLLPACLVFYAFGEPLSVFLFLGLAFCRLLC